MPGATTRINLYKPGGGSTGTITPDEVADIDKLNENFDKIDAAVGAFPCTSSTRPATPFQGQIIRESDTGKTLIRVGSDWVDVAPGIILIGNTALRDAAYPAPGSAAARVALANQIVRFWNTDVGYEQMYYAQFDDAGATAATPTKEVFGWGPRLDVGSVLLTKWTAALVGGVGTITKKGGMLDFAGVQGFTIDNIFSAAFPRYEMRLTTVDFSTGGQITAQLRVGGVTDTAANYAYSYREFAGGTDVGVGPVSNMIVAQGFDGTNVSTHEIVDPFDAARRTMMMLIGGFNSDTKTRVGGSMYNTAKSFDGIYLDTDSTNTMHGNIRFYGIPG